MSEPGGRATAASRLRAARRQAKDVGLVMTKSGDVYALRHDHATVVTGDLSKIERHLGERYARRPPGPAAMEAPVAWQPWMALFLGEQNAAHRSPQTIKTRAQHLTAFAHGHPGVTPLTVTRAQLIVWVGDQTRKPRTAHSIRSTMRVFFRTLYDLGHRRDNPAATLPSISLPRSLPRPCPDHVVQTAYGSVDDGRLLLAIRITVETGLRRAEVAHVHPRDVEGRAGDFRLHIVGKGNHERTVPISDSLADRILGHTGYLFAGWNGQPITPRHLGKLITRALPGEWTTHTLRHRFATVAYQTTGDLRVVQDLLGHTSPVTTAIYTKVADQAMRRAALAAVID